MIPYSELERRLPPERLKRIAERSAEMIAEHNEHCSDDDIVWCECEVPARAALSCDSCGGALEGAVILAEHASKLR